MTRTVVAVENDKFDCAIAAEILDGVAEVWTVAGARPHEVIAAANGADAVIPWGIPLTAPVLEELSTVSIIGICGTGVAGVDLDAAAAHDITVVNAATYAVEEVATHAMALLLSCVRSLPQYDAAVRDGEWGRAPGAPVHRLQGRTLGLLGFGDIARRTAELAQAFGCNIIAHDPYVDASEFSARDVTSVPFADLLGSSELLSVHAPITAETRGLLDADAFARMGDDVILVNTGRGTVIEEAALLDALRNGTVAKAGLDVYEAEPLGASPLCEREDVILTPHVAWYSEESREDAIREVATDIRRFFTGEQLHGKVDPETPWL